MEYSTSTRQPPLDIPRLQKAYENAFVIHKTHTYIQICRDVLNDAVARCTREPEERSSKLTAYFWLKATEAIWHQYGVHGRSIEEMENFIVFINKNQLINYLVEDYNDANTITSVCMAHVLISENGWLHFDSSAVMELIQTWLGKSIDRTISLGPERVSDLLYGPAVWSLCAADIKDLHHVPYHLWTQKLPLPGPGGAKESPDTNVLACIPTDIA